jgi:hypothetical protein
MMKGSRAYAVRTLALIISIIAVVLALGGGAYASAHSTRHSQAAQSQATGVRLTEHGLKLINGWQSADQGNGTGSPRFAVNAGVVHLSGSLKAPNPASTEFALLPSWARPGHVLYLLIYTSEGAVGTLQIFPNGALVVYSGNPASAHDFSSLAGVSFPVGA